MKHLGHYKAILYLDIEVDESKNQVGGFMTSALKSLVKAVEVQKILKQDTEISTSDAAPCESLFYPEKSPQLVQEVQQFVAFPGTAASRK